MTAGKLCGHNVWYMIGKEMLCREGDIVTVVLPTCRIGLGVQKMGTGKSKARYWFEPPSPTETHLIAVCA